MIKNLRVNGHINYVGIYLPIEIEVRVESEHYSDVEKIIEEGFKGYPIYTNLSSTKCGICHINLKKRGSHDEVGGRTILFCWNPKCKQYNKYYSEKAEK